MKKQFMISLLMGLTAVCSGVSVVFAADKAEFPIAVVDGTAVFQKFQPGIESELKKEFADEQQKLVKMQEELQSMSEKLEKEASIMKESQIEKLQEQFAEKQMAFQQKSMEYNEAYNKRGNEVFQKLIDKVQTASSEIAKENGYKLVVQRGAVLYADEQLDVTEQLVKKVQHM